MRAARRAWPSRWTSAAIAALLACVGACGVGPLDLENRRCPCVDGWTCDTARDVCIRDGGSDAAADAPIDASPPDAGVDLAVDLGIPVFGAPVAVAELNGPDDDQDPSLTEDELVLLFVSDRSGNLDIWTSVRTSVGETWPAPSRVTELDTSSVETDPEVSADGLHVFFSSQRGGNQDVWESSRATRADAWSAPVRVVELSSADDDCCVVLSDDALHTVFASARSGMLDLYVASRADVASPWGGVAPLGMPNGGSADANPFWDATTTQLFFDSDRPGGQGGRDVYFAARATAAGVFGAAHAVPSLATPFDERDVWVSRDGRRMWLASDVSGRLDLYTVDRTSP